MGHPQVHLTSERKEKGRDCVAAFLRLKMDKND
jgi:hypothetical protein